MAQGLDSGRAKIFILSPKCLDQLWGPCIFLFHEYQGFFLLEKLQGCVIDCSIPLALRLRKGGAVHMVLLFVFMTWTGTVYFYALYVSCKYIKKISASKWLCCLPLKMELRIVIMEYTCINSVKKICYICTFTYIYTQTHMCARYIVCTYTCTNTCMHTITSCHVILFPWIHKFVKMTVGYGISHKHTKYTKCAKCTESWQGKVL